MDNPFQALSDAFQPEYRVNLSIQRLDGSIMLTLSNERGVAAKRVITAEQRNDPKRMRRLIESIQFGMAIEQGGSAMQILAAMTDAGNVEKLAGKQALHTSATHTSPVAASLQ
jgi:ADP-ribosylglycohydrolase